MSTSPRKLSADREKQQAPRLVLPHPMVYLSFQAGGATHRQGLPAGDRREVWAPGTGNRSEGPPRRFRETGAEGIGRGPTGDPSGSSIGPRPGRPKGLPPPGDGGRGTGPPWPSGHSDLGPHRRRLRPTAPRSESGPRPDEERDENPERVEASAKAPSGFLASWTARELPGWVVSAHGISAATA